ncbi:MAG: lipoate--protein ligase [Spirochaetaceae bacterium]|jgi:lipoate-protein ligase A|nr:lipoate--protein ligase [Spirochaetaceae bacterium]
MIDKTFVIETSETVPYKNIALEAFLLEQVEKGACILYLWQNRHTVVIGRNQNAFKECRVKELEDSGGFLARRLSGGGAVYHDMGNLNFTFLMREEDYDLGRQTDVILRAVQKLGVKAQKSGRNDIEADGRKFSGNAFYKSGGSAYHHGTLLVKADKEAAARYLSASQDKIRSKGVDSVKSRIVNLTELNPAITIPSLSAALRESFDEVYGVKAEELEKSEDKKPHLIELEEKFAAPEWKYGMNPPFEFQAEKRFPWGGIELHFDVKDNTISGAHIFSDAMDGDFILALAERLRGAPFTYKAVLKRLANNAKDRDSDILYAVDIADMIFDGVADQ